MVKHILVPTDGSQLSRKAIRAAARLAKAFHARLTGYAVTEDYSVSAFTDRVLAHTPGQEAFSAEQARLARHHLKAVTEEAAAAGVECETDFAPAYDVYKAIIDAARARACDLIVMASHSHRTLGGVVLGSETNKVLTHSAIAVLVYRAHHEDEGLFRHILLPTDGSPLSHAAVEGALAFAQGLGAKVTVLHVEREQPPQAYGEGMVVVPIGSVEQFRHDEGQRSTRILEAVEKAANARGVPVVLQTRINNHPADAILQAAHDARCDLIYMASHGRRGMSALLLGSETTRVLMHSGIPVLVHR